MAPVESSRKIKKFNPLNHKNLLILKAKIPNVINDENLKSIVKKYETCQNHEIAEKLQLLENLQPITIHRIRDYINRKNRKSKPSDTHSLTSDYSTPHSNSSTTSCASEYQELKQKITNFWSYSLFQKSFCEILFKYDDLNLLSNHSIEINFQKLKPNCRNDILNLINNYSSKLSQPGRKNELLELTRKIDLLLSSESSMLHIYSLLKNDKSVSVDKNGICTFDLISLSNETLNELTELVDFLYSKLPTANKTNQTELSRETEPNSFDKSRLRELMTQIKTMMNNPESVIKIKEIISKYELDDGATSQPKFNLKNLNNTTLYQLEKYIANKTNQADLSRETGPNLYDKSRLRELMTRIKTLMNNGDIVKKIKDIISKYELDNVATSQPKFNLEQLNKTTLYQLEKYINSL